MPRGIEITDDNLEDELACNDIFLDYFNAFLALPVFPQSLYYNRLTGTFEEVEGTLNTLSGSLIKPSTPLYGATDEERQQMLQWACTERLPTFLRAHLYREFKLCKLLLRPLSDEATRHNSAIRGYSRQTESYISSLSQSGPNSANDEDFNVETDFTWAEFSTSNIYQYPRPLSKARSLPAHLGIGRTYVTSSGSLTRDNLTSKQTTNNSQNKQHASADSKSTRDRQTMALPKAPSELSEIPSTALAPSNVQDVAKSEILGSIIENGTHNTPSEPEKHAQLNEAGKPEVTAEEEQLMSHNDLGEEQDLETSVVVHGDREAEENDLTFMDEEEEGREQGERALVSFPDDLVSEAQTEADVRLLEGKHKMTLQHMKEKVISSVRGMTEFQNFLQGTNGTHLLHFWLDCEEFKDTMEDFDDDSNFAKRNQLFREIQDKYRQYLSPEARKQISSGAMHLSHTVFIRTQYDILRRLRAYWLPRFLIHKERKNELKAIFDQDDRSTSMQWPITKDHTNSGLFPSISLVNSMPCKPEEVLQIAMTTSWDVVSKGGRRLDERIKSAKPLVRSSASQSLEEKLVLALSADRKSGGPFRAFLTRHKDREHSILQSNLSFWEDVTEYGVAEDRSADRLLRMQNAWTIFNQYLSLNCPQSTGIDQKDRDDIHRLLLKSSDFVEVTIFNSVKENAIKVLEKSWIRYLKEDMKSFLDHCHIMHSESRPGTAEEIEVLLDEGQQRLVVRPTRPWVRRYPPSTESERGQRLRTALSMADSIYEARRAEQRARAKEKRKQMEKERRKAIKAARKRQKEAKMNQGAGLQPKEAEAAEIKPEERKQEVKKDEDEDSDDEDERPDFASTASNKGMVSLFKKYLTENEGRDATNNVSLYMDVEALNNINQSDKKTKIKKEAQASIIFKTYMEQGAKKRVLMSDKVYNKLKTEKNRPRSSTLKDVQTHLLPKIEEHFKKFWETQTQEHGGENNQALATKPDIAMATDADPGLLTTWKRKGKARKSTGIAKPTSQDQQEFSLALSDAGAGQLPPQMLHFYLHLVKYGEEGECPYADKDLFFYCEVYKFKAAHHAYSDEAMLKRKVQALLDCFLDTGATPPLQIDIKSEAQQRIVRAARRYLDGKDISSSIFDEAMYQVFKELLPFWAGFMKIYEPPIDQIKKPMTKKERERKQRLDDILHSKPPSAKKVTLPILPKGTNLASITFTLNEGVKWTEGQSSEGEIDPNNPGSQGRWSNMSKKKSGSLLSIIESAGDTAVAATG